jgi:hypothetical protein
MNSEDYFLELKTKSEYISKLNFDNVSWFEHIGWMVHPLDNNIIDKEPLLKKIGEKFEIKSIGVMKTPPNSVYNWHTDDDRGVSINMLLTHNHISHCVFTKKTKEKRKDIFPILELDYKSNTFYVFNTQELHTVLNLSATRYMFSLEFKDKKDKLLYNQVKQYCIDNNI